MRDPHADRDRLWRIGSDGEAVEREEASLLLASNPAMAAPLRSASKGVTTAPKPWRRLVLSLLPDGLCAQRAATCLAIKKKGTNED